jgi:hypothetical protein
MACHRACGQSGFEPHHIAVGNEGVLVLVTDVLLARLALSALMPVINGIRTLTSALAVLGASSGISLALGPVGWIGLAATGLGLLATGVANYRQSLEDLRAEQNRVVADLEQAMPKMTSFALRHAYTTP